MINDLITDRLKNALQQEAATKEQESEQLNETTVTNSEPTIITTAEELEGFYTVRAALRSVVPMNRITYKDSLTYFAILLDDNNRKTICRLYFNGIKKFISTFDEAKKETKTEITSMDDIFRYTDIMTATIQRYDNPVKSAKPEEGITEGSANNITS